MNVSIRPETTDDRNAIRLVNQLAFRQNAESTLVDALRDGGYVRLSLIAEGNGRVVGHILFSEIEIQTTAGTLPALSLAPMAVLPDYQNQGVGSSLVRQGLRDCQALGHRIVLVLGHAAFYPRFGFSTKLAKALSSPFGGGESWMALELDAGALQDIAGPVQYSPPFLEL